MPSTAKQAAADRGSRLDVDTVMKQLAAPFDASEVRFKPGVVSGNRALALAYVDARVIQDRLDEVLGVAGWQDSYKCLPHGTVICRLRLRLGEEWITKMDVGGQSEQSDGGDRVKAAFSDALKRAAVKFGIGRYLYRIPSQWCDYDPKRRQFVRTPTLEAPAPAVSTPAPVKPAKSEAASPLKKGHALPTNGVELQRRLYDYDARLAKQGVCRQGDLVKHVVQAGVKAGHDSDLATWSGPAIVLAVEETKAFEARARERAKGHKEVA
jgi:hypothetical protein